MISLEDLNEETIAEINKSYFDRIETGDLKQMKLSNKGKEVPFSVDNFDKAVKYVLDA